MSRFIRKILLIIFWGLMSAWVAGVCAAEEKLAVITQRDAPISSLSVDTLRLVFMRKMLLDNQGNRWIPVNLEPNNEIRRLFSLSLFKQLPEQQEDFWNEQYFNGITPPKVFASEEAIIRFVSITPGAIGYINKDLVDDRIKVLRIIETADLIWLKPK